METEKESVKQLNLIAAVCIYEYDAALFFLYLLQSKCCIALKVLNNFVDSFWAFIVFVAFFSPIRFVFAALSNGQLLNMKQITLRNIRIIRD